MSNPKQSKEAVRERLLAKLDDIIEGDSEKTSDRLRAIETYGREFGLFIEQRKVSIDVQTVVKHLTDGQLNQYAITAESGDFIDVESAEGPRGVDRIARPCVAVSNGLGGGAGDVEGDDGIDEEG